MEEGIRHFRLINGDELIAEYLGEDNGRENHLLYCPMIARENSDGSVVLTRFMPFSDDQAISIQKSHVISISTIRTEFEEYYHNSIKYTTKFLEPSIVAKVVRTNIMMSQMINDDVTKFQLAVEDMITSKASSFHINTSVH